MSFWDIVFDDAINSGYSSQSQTQSWLQQHKEAEEKERRRQFDETLKKLFFGDDDNSGPELLRDLVESSIWFVPVKDDGSFDVVNAKRGEYKLAIGEGENVKGKKGGKGGQLLPVFADDKRKRKFTRLDGRELVRSLDGIAGGVEGLLLHLQDKPPLELRKDHFAELRSLVVALDLEEVLGAPAPEQVEFLKSSIFLIEMQDGKAKINYTNEIRVIDACTHRDRTSKFASGEYVPMTGEQLFRLVVEDPELDGVLINPLHTTGIGSQKVYRLFLSVDFAHNLLKGIDIRPGAHPLAARTFEEVKLWLKMRRFPGKDRKLIDAPLPEHTLVRATVHESCAWSMQEGAGNQYSSDGQTWSPVFALPPNVPPAIETCPYSTKPGPDGYGTGASAILCAGFLAGQLNARFYKEPETYKFGRWILFGRYLDAFDLGYAQERLAVARELLKLIPPGENRVPRHCIRTIEGTAYIRDYPYAIEREWIEATIKHAERFQKPFVWFS